MSSTAQSTDNDNVLRAYFTFQILALVLLPCLLITSCFPSNVRVRPQPILISLIIAWTFSCITFCLLLFTRNLTGPPPPLQLCLAQSAFVVAERPMVSAASLAVVLHIRNLIVSAGPTEPAHRGLITTVLVILPYIFFFVIATVAALIGVRNTSLVSRKTFYCSLNLPPLLMTVAVLSAIMSLLTIAITIRIAMIVRKNWTRLSSDDKGTSRLVIRVLAFGFYVLLAFSTSLVAFFDFASVVPDLFSSTTGLAIVLIFGSQKEVLRTWRTWVQRAYDNTIGAMYPQGKPKASKTVTSEGPSDDSWMDLGKMPRRLIHFTSPLDNMDKRTISSHTPSRPFSPQSQRSLSYYNRERPLPPLPPPSPGSDSEIRAINGSGHLKTQGSFGSIREWVVQLPQRVAVSPRMRERTFREEEFRFVPSS